MADEGIGDRADHPAGVDAEPRIQHVSHEDHVGCAIRLCHIVHTVIGGCADEAAEFHQPPKPGIDRAVEVVRFRLRWRVPMLHVVREGEIEQAGAALLQQPNADIEHEKREIGGILIGLPAAHEAREIIDPMRLCPCGIRVLRRDGDTHGPDRQAFRECAPELVLRGDDCRGHPGLGHAREDGGRPQLLVARHHDGLAGTAIQIEISGDAMHRWRRTCDEGAVVGVSKAREGRKRLPREPFLRDAGEAGQLARRKPTREIVRIAAIEAEHRDRALRQRIGAAIHRDPLRRGVVLHDVPPLFPGTDMSAKLHKGERLFFRRTRPEIPGP